MSILDTQVGGDHYKSNYQPIQFMADYNLNYIQGNVLKYVVRFRKKNGIEDLKKAIHYCELGKAVKFENISEWDADKSGRVSRFLLENGMREPVGMYFIWHLCRNHLDKCKECIEELIKEEYGEKMPDAHQ